MKNNQKLFSKLWKSCNDLRGKFDPSEYKYIILTIIFLKFASEFNNEKKKNDDNSLNDIKVPNGYNWKDILEKFGTGNELPNFVDEALQKYAEINDAYNLNGLWKKFSEKFKNDSARLENIISNFANEDFGKTVKESRDILGNCYEYFLSEFGAQSGKKAGEFYTPKTIVELMVDILIEKIDLIDHENINIYDPTAGSGGMFIQSSKLIKKKDYCFWGQEINDNTYTLAIMNLAIRGLSFKLGDYPEDTLMKDLHENNNDMDIVIANPPFNLTIDKNKLKKDDKRWKYGIPKENKANYYFLQHMISKMSDDGVMGILLDNGSQTSNATKDIRKNILKDDLYEAVIELPTNIFIGTGIAATLYILRRNKNEKTKNKILFIDAKDNFIKNGKINILSSSNIKKIVDVYKDFTDGKNINIKNFAISTDKNEILNNFAISLSPRQYIKIDIENIDHKVEYENSLKELKKDIKDIQKEFKDLLKLMEKNKEY